MTLFRSLYATQSGDIAVNDPVSFHLRSDAVEATYKADLDFANFTSYTQYRYDHTPYNDDLDATAMPWLSLYIDVKDTTFSQEFLFNSKPGSRLQWTAGANYFYYKDDWSNLKASGLRSEEHTSELQSLMRISYAVFCLKK